MPEILLSINPQDVPPIARGLVSTDIGGDPKYLTRHVKDALYPGWSTFRKPANFPENLGSFYRVNCETEAQAFLAKSLAPDNARIEIIIEKPETLLTSQHPLTESIKMEGARKWVNAAHLLSIGFSALSLGAALALAKENNNYNIDQRLIMSGLTAAGYFLSMSAILLTSPAVREKLTNFLTRYNFLYNLPKAS